MAQGGLIGNGVRVAYSLSSPISLLAIGQVFDITLPGLSRADVENSTHLSVYERTMPGMITVSEMKLMLIADLDPSTSIGTAQKALEDLLIAGTTVYWRVEVPTNRARSLCVAREFQGYVKTHQSAAPLKDKQTLETVVKFDDTTFVRYAASAFTITAS